MPAGNQLGSIAIHPTQPNPAQHNPLPAHASPAQVNSSPSTPPDGLVKVHGIKVQGVHVAVHDPQVEVVALTQVVANQCLAAAGAGAGRRGRQAKEGKKGVSEY
jgi:hypothetical protein